MTLTYFRYWLQPRRLGVNVWANLMIARLESDRDPHDPKLVRWDSSTSANYKAFVLTFYPDSVQIECDEEFGITLDEFAAIAAGLLTQPVPSPISQGSAEQLREIARNRDLVEGEGPSREETTQTTAAAVAEGIVYGELFSDLPALKQSNTDRWLTKCYTLDQKIGIAKLWNEWHQKRGAYWTRKLHAEYFQIPEGVLSNWITRYK